MAKRFEDMTEVDVAYKILNDVGKGNEIYYKDLILEILKKKNKSVQNEAATISEIYTMINMDSRFQYNSEKKKWGLTEWDPPEIKKRRATKTQIDKSEEE